MTNAIGFILYLFLAIYAFMTQNQDLYDIGSIFFFNKMPSTLKVLVALVCFGISVWCVLRIEIKMALRKKADEHEGNGKAI